MSLATLVDGHCHLGRGNPEAVSEMGILHFILGDGFRRVCNPISGPFCDIESNTD